MELLNALGLLWRRRLMLGVGVVLALAAALLLAHRMPGVSHRTVAPPTGLAIAHVLVDRPRSLIADTDPDGADTAQIRAEILADLTASSDAEAMIARTAGLREDQLVVNSPQVAQTVLGSPLTQRAAQAATALVRPYIVGVNVAQAAPLVTIDAKAPTVAGARSLVQAAVTTLAALAETTGPQGPSAVVVTPLGSPEAIAIGAPGQSKKLALAAAVLLLGAWVFMTLVIRAPPRARLPRRRVA